MSIMDIKKYTHKVKVFHDKWMKKPQEVEVSLPFKVGTIKSYSPFLIRGFVPIMDDSHGFD